MYIEDIMIEYVHIFALIKNTCYDRRIYIFLYFTLMKYFYLLMTLFILSLSYSASAWWWSSPTTITSSGQFAKKEGRHTLSIQQPYYINPFARSTITRDQFNNYTVNGIAFNRSHPLWRYNINGLPNQSILSTRSSSKLYLYDTIKPYCGTVKLYIWDEEINPLNWTNQEVTATVACVDTGSQCPESRVVAGKMTHGETRTPNVGLIDNAWNRNTCSSALSAWAQVLIDERNPAVTSLNFAGVDISGESDIFEFKAGNTDFEFAMIDQASTNYGVSGLKSYTFDVTYVSDHTGALKNEIVCSQSTEYDSYNPLGDLDGQNIQSATVSCSNIYRTGNYRVNLSVRDDAGNLTEKISNITLYPNDARISTDIELLSSTQNSSYANNSDNYNYRVRLTGLHNNPIYDRVLTWINQAGTELDFQTIRTNMTNNTGADGLIEEHIGVTDTNGQFDITLRSLAPWVFSESFLVTLAAWDNSYDDTNLSHEVYANTYANNSFLKPFTWALTITDETLVLSQQQQTELNIVSQNCSTCESIVFSNFIDSFNATGDWFIVETKENERDLTTIPKLDFVLNHDGLALFDISNLSIQVSPYISYTLWNQLISYILSPSEWALNQDPIPYSEAVFYGLKVVGALQWQWKQTVTGQQDNFSDITKIEIRKNIRKNASDLTQGMSNGQVLNGVKYVSGDYTLDTASINYETLVVEGDLTIDQNIETNLGIIVLDGDIILENNVTIIEALMYADGSIISDGTGQTQLRITGSVFTRNTIGGALGTSGNYILPGWSTTTDYDAARASDLNFLRVGNSGWDTNGNGSEDIGEYRDASTLIISNPQNQINPPKGFESE